VELPHQEELLVQEIMEDREELVLQIVFQDQQLHMLVEEVEHL
jgi:hypothetical protein